MAVGMELRRRETFAKLHKTANFVIPAKAGIQYYQILPGFRVKPGMTDKRIMQRSGRDSPWVTAALFKTR